MGAIDAVILAAAVVLFGAVSLGVVVGAVVVLEEKRRGAK